MLLLLLILLLQGRAAYAQANDEPARARALSDAGRFSEAVRILETYLQRVPDDAGSHWLLARNLYWLQRYRRALLHYERALALQPDNTALREDYEMVLAASRAARAPWMAARTSYGTDNQPLQTVDASAQMDAFVSATILAGFRAGVQRLDAEGETTSRIGTLAAAFAWVPERTRAAVRLAAGAQHNSSADAARPIGSVTVEAAAWRDVKVSASASRTMYHATRASIDTMLPVTAFDLIVQRQSESGIALAAQVRRDAHDDGTEIGTAYAWILVPVWRRVRFGYAASRQDADTSSWTGTEYAPYYTPEDVVVHSLLADAAISAGVVKLHASIAAGVRARELVPFTGPPGIGVQFYERSFTPWRLSASLSRAFTNRASVALDISHERTAFYDISVMQLTLAMRGR